FIPRVHPKHIENAFIRVRDSELVNADAQAYKKETHIDLTGAEIDRLFDQDVNGFLEDLGNVYPSFVTFPEPAKRGMLDMIYTLGKGGFEKFKRFKRAVDRRNWKRAGAESGRKIKDEKGNVQPNETMDRRNAVVLRWFLEAARDEPFFIEEGLVKALQIKFK
ncbi:MAG: hypothetical protein O7A65_04480, partial [Proteobacteria bacterium]|nr:hypothetical protein [Pseudomonadota bacterium]